MAQLYIAKVHCESHMLEVYDQNIQMREVLNYLSSNIKDDIRVERNDLRTTHDGDEHYYTATYSISGVVKENGVDRSVAGNLYKVSDIFYNRQNEHGNLVVDTVPNTEVISFYFDVYKELVCFFTKRRFGTDEITTALSMLFTHVCEDRKIEFSIDLMRRGFSFEHFKNRLQELNQVEEIKITIKAPNPNSALLDGIIEESGDFIEDLKDGNITQTSIVLTSKAPTGMNVNSRVVQKELEQLTQIHASLDPEEAVENNYVKVDAKGKRNTISTKDTKPLQYKIDDYLRSIRGVVEVGKEFINSIR